MQMLSGLYEAVAHDVPFSLTMNKFPSVNNLERLVIHPLCVQGECLTL